EIRTSRFTRGSVPHTVPLASTATPNGAAPGVLIAWRGHAAALGRLELCLDASAKHTAPPGAEAKRAGTAARPGMANDATTPSGDMREIRRLGPSVYHA